MTGELVPYSEEHYKAKQEALINSKGKCEITNTHARDLIAHHLAPKSLTFFNFTDDPDNYIILREHYHKLLHKVCNVNTSQVHHRQNIARELLKDPYNDDNMRKLDDMDKQLVPEYVSNTITLLPHYMWKIVVQRMLESGFYMQRNLSIEIHKRDLHIKKLEGYIKKMGEKYNFDAMSVINNYKST